MPFFITTANIYTCMHFKMLPPTNSTWVDRATFASILPSKHCVERCVHVDVVKPEDPYVGIDG